MSKKIVIFVITAFFFLTSLAGCTQNSVSPEEKVEITVSAAASLQDALIEIAALFEENNPNIELNLNFGGSGSLQQQISQGAPVDIFFSAAEDKFNKLIDEGLIEQENSIKLLQNELVLIIPSSSGVPMTSFEDLSSADKISIGTPESVPAGKYAKETLENLGIWDKLESRMVFAKDVRQVLTYVETGNVDAGIVYQTDAMISDSVKIITAAEANLHTPVIYPAGLVKSSSKRDEAELFLTYLQSEETLKIFEKYGFKGWKQ
ncbi:molybdate transport system substrate-binding protein [Gracilibacillus ureilyticus]|uniref:Molybdate transport system substrate-binding protein n=1 Tax=Gracilibacillus ureilyticus TaxID=531814 RepID=A0A1H9T165_9BACI|nr:molybdate ABC transporter substrate-binding protein [Gracilibacillus ureilyticus]SER90744.1 molybdate transport system substrate-binding protein [Gracilibacillus ureilyticus]